MRRPSRVAIIRDLQEALWQMIEPQIDLQHPATTSDKNIMRMAVQRFVEAEAKSLSLAELADMLDSPAQTMTLFLEYLRSKGIAGDPVAMD